jgi:polyhydroxybutyrate depolymerase
VSSPTARRVLAAFAAALMIVLAAACSSSNSTTSTTSDIALDGTEAAAARASGPSAGCDRSPPAPPGTTDERITSEGVERSYELIIPEGYDGTKPLPIVFGLHSLTVDYHIVPPMSGFGDMAGPYDFIGVAPSGRLSDGKLPYWNAAPAQDNYDLVFLTDLLDHLEATLCVDTAKVFSVGMSNGAQMSSLLACRLGDRIAAIAPIAGVEYNEPCDGPPVPVIAFHGLADPIVPYAGGGLNSVRIADSNYYKGNLPTGIVTPTGVDESMRRWAGHNGCDPEPVEERIGTEVRKRTWQNCAAATVLYIVDIGGHSWPGKPQPGFEAQFGPGTTQIDASTLLFQFFFDEKV